MLAIYHSWLIWISETTNENIYGKYDGVINPYSLGGVGNCLRHWGLCWGAGSGVVASRLGDMSSSVLINGGGGSGGEGDSPPHPGQRVSDVAVDVGEIV